MKNSIRFSEGFFNQKLKNLIESITCSIEQFHNINSISYFSTIQTKEKYDANHLRFFNYYKNDKFLTNFDLIIKNFFRSYSDCTIIKDSYMYSQKQNFSEFLESSTFKEGVLNFNIRPLDGKKSFYICSKNPKLNFFNKNEFFNLELVHFDIFTNKKYEKIFNDSLQNKNNFTLNFDNYKLNDILEECIKVIILFRIIQNLHLLKGCHMKQ